MDTAVAVRGKSVAVTAVGLLTLLFGVVYTTLGGCFAFTGDALTKPERNGDPVGGYAFLLWFFGAIALVFGTALFLQGLLGIFAAIGLLKRMRVGQIATLLMAALAIPGGVFLINISYERDPVFALLGAFQILYGHLAIIVLIQKRGEFASRIAELEQLTTISQFE